MNQTPINESFQIYNPNNSNNFYNLQPKFSITCIYCTNSNTKGINQEGTFRQCLNCRKQFQCVPQAANNLQNIPSLIQLKEPKIFQSLQRPIFIEPKKYSHETSYPETQNHSFSPFSPFNL
jgi:hypothetical protein